ncbi:MAG TPA: aquaporin [Candidatus Eisenbacteria bacterium]|nr:aquaporin [Candidatus Eisenbacteria bacterium]
MKKYLTEFIGTFFLVLTIGLSVLSQTPMAPLAIGSALMVMVYMGGHISGAHYNPAVTLAIVMRGKLPAKEMLPYWASQILGAFLASMVTNAMVGQTFAPSPSAGVGAMAALVGEVLFTFALALVVLNVATARATAGNSYYGLAIGFTVLAGAWAAGPVSGGAFNPAVGTGPILFQAILGGSLGNLWLYWVGPLLGAVIASVAFRLQHGAEAD